MPFRRCQKCGTEFLAKTDDIVLCRPDCSGPRSTRVDVIAAERESASWPFPVFFLICCAITYYVYTNAYEVELYWIQNAGFAREAMADKLAASMPDSFDWIINGVNDPDIEVALSVLEAFNRQVDEIPEDTPGINDFVLMLKEIYENPEEDSRLKKACVTAMGAIHRPEVVDVLRTAINHDAFKEAAVLAMKKVPDPRFIGPLSDIVIDDMGKYMGRPVRFHAVIALGLIEEDSGATMKPLLVAFRDLGNGSVRDEAMKGIVHFCKRFDSLSITGKEEAVRGLNALKLYCKSDTFHGIRERGKIAIAELESIVKM